MNASDSLTTARPSLCSMPHTHTHACLTHVRRGSLPTLSSTDVATLVCVCVWAGSPANSADPLVLKSIEPCFVAASRPLWALKVVSPPYLLFALPFSPAAGAVGRGSRGLPASGKVGEACTHVTVHTPVKATQTNKLQRGEQQHVWAPSKEEGSGVTRKRIYAACTNACLVHDCVITSREAKTEGRGEVCACACCRRVLAAW